MPIIFKTVGDLHGTSSSDICINDEDDHDDKVSELSSHSQTFIGNYNGNESAQQPRESCLAADESEKVHHNYVDALSTAEIEPFFQYILKRRIPRMYYITTQLILPLLTLIGLSFLFGWMLARFEMVGEIEANDAAVGGPLSLYLFTVLHSLSIWDTMGNSTLECVAEEFGIQNDVSMVIPSFNESALYDCSFEKGRVISPIMEPLDFLAMNLEGLSFDWMLCPQSVDMTNRDPDDLNYSSDTFDKLGLNIDDNHDRQLLAYILNFYDDFESTIEEAGMKPEDVFFDFDLVDQFAGSATGSKGCKVHLAGGALFWFTIMTTIGYGNTAPTTSEGGLLVYTGGFLSIIGFLALNNTAANVWKNLAEDVFLRYKLKWLVKGPLSVLFWCCVLILWVLVLAVSMQRYRRNRTDEDFSLADAYWFSYITSTTVGFGDIHISHEEFTVGDMFFLPLLVLMSFNFLGIFAEKGVDLYNRYFPEEADFKHILQEQRRERMEGKRGGGHGKDLGPYKTVVYC